MNDSKLLKGTFILTLGTYISRILGMIYLFPFHALVGGVGGALFAYGYGQYTIFLSIATMGFPQAVSKFVSKYNALGDYHTSRRMFKSGLIVMTITGFLAFLFLYLLAPVLAPAVLGDKNLENSVDDVIMVIRMVSVALIVVPSMSVIRGFFQGHQSMGPTAVSQVVEQLVRIVFLLASSFIIIKILDGDVATAVGYATFAAFIGALGGLAVLYWYWRKRKAYLDELLTKSKPPADLTTMEMFKELLSYAGPFVFVGLAIPLYQYVDQFTFNKAMIAIGEAKKTEDIFSMINLYVPKLVMIPVSLATAFGLTLVPAITDTYTAGNFRMLTKQIDQSFQVIVFLVFPAVVGLSVLSYPIYGAFYEADPLGGEILRWYAPLALLFSFFTVNAAILQGINKQKFAVVSLAIGLLLKIVLNVPLVTLYQGVGSILATAIGYTVSILYTFWMIKRHARYRFTMFLKRSLLMVIFSLIMAASIILVQWLLSFWITYDQGRLHSVIIMLIGVVVGGAVYLYLSYRSYLLGALLGNRFSFFKRQKKQKAV
jgi:polysaccharide transporter, PST family